MKKAIVVYTTEIEHRSKNLSRIRREIKKEVGREVPVIVLPDGCSLEVSEIGDTQRCVKCLLVAINNIGE